MRRKLRRMVTTLSALAAAAVFASTSVSASSAFCVQGCTWGECPENLLQLCIQYCYRQAYECIEPGPGGTCEGYDCEPGQTCWSCTDPH